MNDPGKPLARESDRLREIRVNAMLGALQSQRDAALNQVAHLSGELAIQAERLNGMKTRLDELSAALGQHQGAIPTALPPNDATPNP